MADAAQNYFDLRQSTRAYQNPYESGGIGVGGLTQSARYNRQQVGSSFLSAPSGTNTWSRSSSIGGTDDYDFGGGSSIVSGKGAAVARQEGPQRTGMAGPEAMTSGRSGEFGTDPLGKKPAYASSELGDILTGLTRAIKVGKEAGPVITNEISNEIRDRQMYGRRGTGGRPRVGRQEANLMTSLNPRPPVAAGTVKQRQATPSGGADDMSIASRVPVASSVLAERIKRAQGAPVQEESDPVTAPPRGRGLQTGDLRGTIAGSIAKYSDTGYNPSASADKAQQEIHDASTAMEFPNQPPNTRVQNRRKKPK